MRACRLLLILLLTAVGGTRRASSLDSVVRGYIRLALELGDRDPDWLDYYYGPRDWAPNPRDRPPSLRTIGDSAGRLLKQLESQDFGGQNAPRVPFLEKQLRALRARAELLNGAHPGFDKEAEELLGTEVPHENNRDKFDAVRSEIARLLPGSNTVASRYAAFDQRFVVPPDRLRAVISLAIEACRQRTRQYISLPAEEHVTVEYTGDKPWDGYSFYQGSFKSVIQINTDFPLTVGRALDLACHEAYPGHHVYNSLREAYVVRGQGLMEFTLQPVFSPQSFASESLASIAPEVAFPERERVAFERDVLFPAAGLDGKSAADYVHMEGLIHELEADQVEIDRDYLDGKIEFLRAGAALERRLLMVDAEATLKYLNEYRSYYLSYTLGKQWAKRCLGSSLTREDEAEARWKRYQSMMASLLFPSSCIEARGRSPSPAAD
jgi:hypothetical protein